MNNNYSYTSFICYYLGTNYDFYEFKHNKNGSIEGFIVEKLPRTTTFSIQQNYYTQYTEAEGVFVSSTNCWNGNRKGSLNCWLLIRESDVFSNNFTLYGIKNEVTATDVSSSTNAITGTISSSTNTINNTLTSTDYNESDVSVNNDNVSNVDTSETDGLFTTIFNNFNSAATGGVDSITIPLPHNSGNIILYSNVVSSHLGNLSALVSAFWYFVFGFYAFKFVNNLLHSIKDGSILDGFKNNNEVITSDML